MRDILKETLITTQTKEQASSGHVQELLEANRPEAQTSAGGAQSGAGWGHLSACCGEAVMQVCRLTRCRTASARAGR